MKPAFLRLLVLLGAVCILWNASLLTAHAQEQVEQSSEAQAAGSEQSSRLMALASDATLPLEDLALRLAPLTRDEIGEVAEIWRRLVQSKTAETVEAQI